jgi:predicted patatin/cPLA2 family phospholipase
VSSVIDVLRARLARGSRRPHGDGASVALAVEGGAMRGVISAGMVTGLEEMGLAGAFDAVYGSSAGAINAAYFLAGQAAVGTTIYYEDINTRDFIDHWRPLRGQPIVDLSFVIDEVMTRRKPLDVARVLASPSPLSVLATDVVTGRSAALSGFTSAADLFSALRAGATMPVVAGTPFAHRESRYVDASLAEPIPVPSAEAAGHTHVLALLTRPGRMLGRASAFDRYFVGPRLRQWSPALADQYLNRGDPYAELLTSIDAGTGPLGRALVQGLRVPELVVHKLERDPGHLRDGAARGREVALAAFRA